MIMSLKRIVPFNDDTKIYNASGVITITKEDYPSFDKAYINEKFDIYFKLLYDSGLISNYYFIYHDSDINNRHIHFALNCYKQIRITTLCNKVALYCEVEPIAVSIDKLLSINAILMYFLHKDSVSRKASKQEYEIYDILSNVSSDEIELLLSDNDSFDLDYVTNVCANCRHEYDLIKKFGIKFFHKYRYELKIILDYTSIHVDKFHKENVDTPF